MAVEDRPSPRGPGARRLRRWGIGAAAVFGWALIVSVAAGRRPPDASWIGLPDLGTLVLLIVVVSFVLSVVAMTQLRPSRYAEGKPAGGIRTLLVVGLLATAAFMIMSSPEELPFEESAAEPIPEELLEDLDSGQRNRLPDSNVVIESEDIVIGLGLVFAAGLALWMLWRRDPARISFGVSSLDAEVVDDAEFIHQLSVAAAGAEHDLSSIADPRQAVLVAYSSLEQVMDRHGHPRLRHETANEHVDRVLGSGPMALDVDRAAVVRLAGLYELARFSSNRVTEDDRRVALADLAQARRQLGQLAGLPE